MQYCYFPTATTMPKDKPEKTLEEEGIYLKHSPFIAKDCSEDVRGLFQLVHDVKGLQFESFARYTNGGSNSNPKPRIQAAHVYDKWLKDQADELSTRCHNPDLDDRHEVEWVEALGPVVFFRFDRDLEERANFHHCFVCRRHYPQQSRPFINRCSERPQKEKFPEDYEICEQTNKHINLPNFAKQRELVWYNDDMYGDTGSDPKDTNRKKGSSAARISSRRRVEKPDVTIGLCTYVLHESPWRGSAELLELEQVNLFDRAHIASIREKFELPVPYRLAKKRIQDSTPQFAFGLWEAKSAVSKNNPLTAWMQSAKKVRALLRCQSHVYERSSVLGVPLAWYFNNIGSYWTVYGCHIDKNQSTPDYERYIVRELWEGNLRDVDKALQLLYIVDMIAIWAEYTYKPSICSCLRNLDALVNKKGPPDLAVNSRIEKLELNRANFPWLLNPDWNTYLPEQVDDTNPQLSGGRLLRPRIRSLQPNTTEISKDRSAPPLLQKPTPNRSARSLSQSPNRGRSDEPLSLHLSPSTYAMMRSPSQNLADSISKQISSASSKVTYINPDLDNYIWIQDKDPGFTNILVLKIDKGGNLMKPIVVLNSKHWQDQEFSQLVRHEKFRWDSDVDTKFLFDRNEGHYLRKLIQEFLIDATGPGIQYCAILPLDDHRYRNRCRFISENDDVFRPIEALLKIPGLLNAIKTSAKKWCSCRRPYNKYSPDMVLCDNMKCKIGWYHLQCLKMDDAPDFWLCPECEATDPSTRLYSTDSDVDYDEELYTESSDRVQLTKAIVRVWAKHKWPKREELLKLMERISRRIVFDSSIQYTISKDGNFQERAQLGSWAIPREPQKKPKMVKVAPLWTGV